MTINNAELTNFVGRRVKIKETTQEGHIYKIEIGLGYVNYSVEYWHNNEKRYCWCCGAELELV